MFPESLISTKEFNTQLKFIRFSNSKNISRGEMFNRVLLVYTALYYNER